MPVEEKVLPPVELEESVRERRVTTMPPSIAQAPPPSGQPTGGRVGEGGREGDIPSLLV